MLRVATLSAWMIVTAICSGCATSSQTVVTAEKQTTALTFIRVGDNPHGYDQLYEAAAAALPSSNDDKIYVQAKCGITMPTGTTVADVSVGEGVLGAFVGGLMKLFTGAISKELEKKIKEYSAAYSATKVVNFYNDASSIYDPNISTPYRCFRFVRVVPDANDKAQALVDFVGRIDIADDQSGLIIKPLRLYVSKAVAKTTKDKDDGLNKHGFAIGIVAKSSWRQGNSGHAGEIFSEVIVSEEITGLPDTPYLKYYEKPDAQGNPPVEKPALRSPIIPYSVGSPVESKERGRAAFEVRVAETGTPPGSLLFFAELFSKSSDAIAELLAASVNKRLGFAEDD